MYILCVSVTTDQQVVIIVSGTICSSCDVTGKRRVLKWSHICDTDKLMWTLGGSLREKLSHDSRPKVEQRSTSGARCVHGQYVVTAGSLEATLFTALHLFCRTEY